MHWSRSTNRFFQNKNSLYCRLPRGSQRQQIRDHDQHSSEKTEPEKKGNSQPEAHVGLGYHVSHAQHALNIGLHNTGYAERKPHQHHGGGHGPECDLSARRIIDIDSFDLRHGVIEDHDVQECIGPEERKVSVRYGDLGAVRIVIDLRQRVHEAPYAGADHMHHRATDGYGPGELIFYRSLTVFDMVHGVDEHEQDRKRLKCREYPAEPEPVFGRADPVVMMARPHDSGKQEEADFDIEPLLYDLSFNTGELHQDECENGCGDEFPGAFHPEMDYPPPIVPVNHLVPVERYSEEVQEREEEQAAKERALDCGPALSLVHGHPYIEQK